MRINKIILHHVQVCFSYSETLFQNIVQGKQYNVALNYRSSGPLDMTISFRDTKGGGILGSSQIIKWALYLREKYDHRNNNCLFFCVFHLYSTPFAML